MTGFLTNGLPTLPQVGQNMRVPVDTEFPRGVNPASVAATALQIAGVLAECIYNNTPVTFPAAAAPTTFGGMVTWTGVTVAPGANVSLTLNHALITAAYLAAGGMPQVGIYSIGNTGGGIPPMVNSAMLVLQSVAPVPGSCVFTWQNQGASAINGTLAVVWHL